MSGRGSMGDSSVCRRCVRPEAPWATWGFHGAPRERAHGPDGLSNFREVRIARRRLPRQVRAGRCWGHGLGAVVTRGGTTHMGKLYVYICGATRVRTDDGALVEKLGGVKPRQILEILALSLGRPVSKDRIADLLWDGEPPPSYVSTLESYVYVLRRHLGIRGRDAAVQTTTTGYLLRADQAQVDVCDAQQMLAAAGRERDQGERARLVGDALQLLDGELLASEPHTPWAAAHRTAFMRDATGWCLEAAEAALASGSTGLAGRLGRF